MGKDFRYVRISSSSQALKGCVTSEKPFPFWASGCSLRPFQLKDHLELEIEPEFAPRKKAGICLCVCVCVYMSVTACVHMFMGM